MGASLSTEERMTADERAEWERATDKIRVIFDRALYRIFAAPMFLALYVTVVSGIIPCSTTTTMTIFPLSLLAGAFMVMTFYQAFFSLKEIGEWMASERVRRAKNNGVESEESELSSFLRFTWHNLMLLVAILVYEFMFLFLIMYSSVEQCP